MPHLSRRVLCALCVCVISACGSKASITPYVPTQATDARGFIESPTPRPSPAATASPFVASASGEAARDADSIGWHKFRFAPLNRLLFRPPSTLNSEERPLEPIPARTSLGLRSPPSILAVKQDHPFALATRGFPGYAQRRAPLQPSLSFRVRLSDLEESGYLNAPLDAAHASVSIINGARILLDLGSGQLGTPVLAMGGSEPLTIKRRADGSWSASGRFIDASNPPNPHPAIMVTFLHAGQRIDERYPILLLHQ